MNCTLNPGFLDHQINVLIVGDWPNLKQEVTFPHIFQSVARYYRSRRESNDDCPAHKQVKMGDLKDITKHTFKGLSTGLKGEFLEDLLGDKDY